MYANFVKKLDSIQEGDGDAARQHALLLRVCHEQDPPGRHYPIILSGGRNMGFRHGSHLHYGDHVPLSNLFVTIANQLGQPTKSFADGTADVTEVLG